MNFALDRIPVFPPLADWGGEPFRGFLNIGPSMDYLERAFDEAKYGRYSSTPYIDGAVQSTIDPDMASPGKHVMSCFIQYTPYRLRESDWAEREPWGTRCNPRWSSTRARSDLVLQREVVTPLDIEWTIGLSEGNIFAGELFAPQMFFLLPGARLGIVPDPDQRLLPVWVGDPSRRCVMGAGATGRWPDPEGPGRRITVRALARASSKFAKF